MMIDNEGEPLLAVHSCWNDVEADIVIAFLASAGIDAMTNSEIPHSVFPLIADGVGEIQILVAREAAGDARRMLAERETRDNGEDGEDAP